MLQISQGKIRAILGIADAPQVPTDSVIYIAGAVVAPGFIDLHVHGSSGRDFMDGSQESLQTIAASLARHGTTSFLATSMSAPPSDLAAAVTGFAAHCGSVTEGAAPLGIHLEGPYLNPARAGAHDARCLTAADVQSFRRLVGLSGSRIREITLAPEMDENLQLTRAAAGMGIRVSLGHSDATYEQARAAVDAGATHATHIFNAMRPFHHREPGIAGLVLTDARVRAEVIADGRHLHASVLQLVLRAKGIDKLLLVTDGVSATDMPEGSYPLGRSSIIVQGKECRNPDGKLAGSVLTLDRAVANLVAWTGVPLKDALAAASTIPARSLGIENKGLIAVGCDADLVFLDENLQAVKTMVAGRVVFSRPGY